MTLQARMKRLLGADWPANLPQGMADDPDRCWRAFFSDCPLDLDSLPDALEPHPPPTILPVRRDADPQGVQVSSHLCKAFDRLVPEQVRVVVLGQDPYPKPPERATGRAFEDGTWNGDFAHLAESLQAIVRSALGLEWNQPELHGAAWDWNEFCAGPLNNPAERAAMSGFFDNLANQGVLFVNAAWTRTLKEAMGAHQDLWRPVTEHLIRQLANAARPVVFLLLGEKAQKTFHRAKPICVQTRIV